jgi:hypothetical protein
VDELALPVVTFSPPFVMVLEPVVIKPAWRVVRPEAVRVDETVVAPVTESVEATLEDAFEMKPLVSVVRPVSVDTPLTRRVDDALSGPDTLSGPETELEAEEMKPVVSVVRPLTLSVEPRFAAPPAWRVPEAESAPATWRPAAMLDEALAMKPVVKVVRPLALSVEAKVVAPVTERVPEALTFPLASTLNRPRRLAEEVAIDNVLAVSVEVVVPSVTWKILVPDIRPLKAPAPV